MIIFNRGFLVFNTFKRKLSDSELKSEIAQFDGVIAGTEVYDRHVLDVAETLKVISRVGVGLDNIDLDYASEKGIRMTAASLSDHLDDEVARSLVIELSSSQLEDERNKEEVLDCLSRLTEIKLRREQEKFNEEIYNVSREKGDNSEILWNLLEQKNKLLKKKQKDFSS